MPELSHSQRQHLVRDGLVELPGQVPAGLVDRARRAIHASLGANGFNVDQQHTSNCPELREQPVITDLYNATALPALAESAIGAGAVRPVTSGQIALRFSAPEHAPARRLNPHLDGMPSDKNGVPGGDIANFTALVGVLLADVPTPDAGNFTILPGSHRRLETYFREHGPQSLLQGMPPIDLGTPRQITGKAGDAFLVHYQVAHGIAANLSPNIRYAVYFRLHRENHEQVHWECMTDIWREWDGLRDLLADAEVGVR